MARKARRPSRPTRKQARRVTAKTRTGTSKRRQSAKKTAKKAAPRRPRRAAKKAGHRARRPAAKTARPAGRRGAVEAPLPEKTPHLDRPRRVLADDTVPSPPSSLNLDRHPSAARSGREEMRHRAGRSALASGINVGDSDVNPEDAYFAGDAAPGGDNPSPDQDVVEEIGKALGVEYNDAEELRGSDKIADRDKHRWELDPASSEDYRDRKR
jgi:hypothetical protein